ncbi:SIS domain-containing protein [Pseudothermotoga thermarum]|nr:SIS domain-containing protein [Pseudothermotoga thermarum]
MDVLQNIRNKYNSFTETERRIADIVLQNPQRILESSISDLTKMTGAKSEAMVTLLAISKPADLVSAISHTGESKGIVEVARKTKQLKIPVVTITGNDKSSLAKLSTVVLRTNTKETKIRTDAMTFRIVQLAILKAIYTIV